MPTNRHTTGRGWQIFAFVGILLLSVAGGAGVGIYQKISEQSADGDDASIELTSLKLSDLSGNDVTFSSIIGENGKILINFWATWCIPCIRELPLLTKASESSQTTLPIAAITYEDAEKVNAFIRQNSIKTDIFITSSDIFSYMQERGNPTMSLPFTILLDAQEQVIAHHLGDFHSVEEILQFANQPPPVN